MGRMPGPASTAHCHSLGPGDKVPAVSPTTATAPSLQMPVQGGRETALGCY